MTDTIEIRMPTTAASAREWKFSFADMIAGIEQLTELLREENKLLAGMRVKAIGELQERKGQLAWLLDLQKQHLAKNPELLASLDADSRLLITRLASDMEKALTENFHRLQSARIINQKIVQAVTAALSDSYGEARGYGETGSRGLLITRDPGTIQPLTLNEKI